MAVYKIFASADASMYSAYPGQNTGLDEILEVGCKNSSVPSSVLSAGTADDIRRALVLFSNSDMQTAQNFIAGAPYSSSFRLYLANAQNLNSNYSIEVRQVSQSWIMGTGQFLDNPITENGVCWNNTGSYVSSSTNWIGSQYLYTPGGGSWTGTYVTQSFGYKDNKDLNVDVTPIVNNWLSGGQQNYGFLVKLPLSVEQNTGSYTDLIYFSVDTHTIYPPTLEFKWDDSSYNTGSLAVVSSNDTVLTIGNNTGTFKNDTGKYVFRINARDKYPPRSFTTSSFYTVNKALPSASYWALQDVKTQEMVIDFDTTFTKVSCDATSSYFPIYMNGLEPERYYKVLVKINLPTGEIIDIDNNNTFKIVR